ncbi:single-stranded DNA-binding protein [Arachidicoccus terrestris]|uniref:single-stranded DNA-binding protein n=1 Tax=Arachidicoccus terrestris TaxID=2875539 RepID=UPI001CC34533|nr:single-stranded DNA-binding protein [Arachidicoccus terrestris]UAY55680.1 single-stranded DNA-binding protein [Arachidicoccus terrestris]
MQHNLVRLIGYVGADLKVKTVSNGSKMAIINVATHDFLRREGDEKIYSTSWHQVIAWGGYAEMAERSFIKGSHILVEGSLRYRKYTDDKGEEHLVTEIKAHSLINLDR